MVVQEEMERQALWVVPTAITFTTFYLVLESLITGQATAAVISQLIAICAMDSISLPWKRYSLQVQVQLQPGEGVSLGKAPISDRFM